MFKILWIDDEPHRYAGLLKWLEQVGKEDILVVFAHGREQVDFYLNICEVKWDVVILDHDMPWFDGMKVVEEFLIYKNLPVILCSNNNGAKSLQKYRLEEFAVPTKICSLTMSETLTNVLDEIRDGTWPNGEEEIV